MSDSYHAPPKKAFFRSVRTALSRRCGQNEKKKGCRERPVAVRQRATEASSGGGEERIGGPNEQVSCLSTPILHSPVSYRIGSDGRNS